MCVNSLYPRPSRYRPLPWLRCTIHHQSPASPTVLCLAVQCPPLPRHELCKIYLHKYEKYICTWLCLAPLNKYICVCEFSSVTTRCKLRGWPSWNKSPFRSYLQTLDINSCKIALLRGLWRPSLFRWRLQKPQAHNIIYTWKIFTIIFWWIDNRYLTDNSIYLRLGLQVRRIE